MAMVTKLLEWCSLHGIYIDRRLEIRYSKETGISVFSTKDIQDPTTREFPLTRPLTGCWLTYDSIRTSLLPYPLFLRSCPYSQNCYPFSQVVCAIRSHTP